jgi:hypothetical protein
MMDRLRNVVGLAASDHEHEAFEFELSQLERRQWATEILLRELEARVAVLQIEQDAADERA